MLNVIASSFSSGKAVSEGKVTLWPVSFSLDGYMEVFKNKNILTGYRNTILYTVIGTFVNVVMTVLCDLPGRNFIMFMFSFTMLFSGGMVPNYMLMKDLGFLNRPIVMIIPGAIGVYNMIITRTNFQQLPKELLEAAKIDGCSDFRFFLTMAIPLSKAILAVITLFYAVGHWNAFFNAKLYLGSAGPSVQPLQIFLQQILLANSLTSGADIDPDVAAKLQTMADLLKYSLIIVASLPVWCVYPFIQKYFVQGVMIGSIKG